MVLPAGLVVPDLNSFRRVTNWDLFASKFRVAACKVSEGTTWPTELKDDYWPEFLSNCRRYGIFPIGYHFLRKETDISDQVGNFLKRLDRGPVGYAVDVEKSRQGTWPSIQQANHWINRLCERTGRSRNKVASYVPRWWWNDYGLGDTSLCDTVCWNSHYSTDPYLGGYAGWPKVDIIQYTNSGNIAGCNLPGDLNIAVGMDQASLLRRLGMVQEVENVDAGMLAVAIVDEFERRALAGLRRAEASYGRPLKIDPQGAIWEIIGRIYYKTGAIESPGLTDLQVGVDEILEVVRPEGEPPVV